MLRIGRMIGTIGRLRLFLGASHDAGLLIIPDPFLEEVGLAGQGDGFHEIEGIGGMVTFSVTEGEEESIGDELDVLFHEGGVHAK